MTAIAQALHQGDEVGITLSPDEENDLERAIAESDADERAGRVFTLNEVLAELGRV